MGICFGPDIGMGKVEYLEDKKLLDEEIASLEEDKARIESELASIPTQEDLVKLEEMAATLTKALGYNLEIPETEKRRIMELLNIKVIVSPNQEIKLEGFFYPQSSGFISQPSS